MHANLPLVWTLWSEKCANTVWILYIHTLYLKHGTWCNFTTGCHICIVFVNAFILILVVELHQTEVLWFSLQSRFLWMQSSFTFRLRIIGVNLNLQTQILVNFMDYIFSLMSFKTLLANSNQIQIVVAHLFFEYIRNFKLDIKVMNKATFTLISPPSLVFSELYYLSNKYASSDIWINPMYFHWGEKQKFCFAKCFYAKKKIDFFLLTSVTNFRGFK